MTETNVETPEVSHFSTVDEVEDPEQLIDFLDVAKALPGIRAAKTDILDRLQPKRASSALDVGCGYGANVVEMARRLRPGGRAIGVDVSETMITEARRRTAGIELAVGFRIGDALALPFEDDSFDICRIETVLQHLADPRRAVAEMARVIDPVAGLPRSSSTSGPCSSITLTLSCPTRFVHHSSAPPSKAQSGAKSRGYLWRLDSQTWRQPRGSYRAAPTSFGSCSATT